MFHCSWDIDNVTSLCCFYTAAIFRKIYYLFCGWIESTWKCFCCHFQKTLILIFFYYIVTVWCIKFILSLLNCQTCVYMSVYITERRKYLKHLLKLQSKCCLVIFVVILALSVYSFFNLILISICLKCFATWCLVGFLLEFEFSPPQRICWWNGKL